MRREASCNDTHFGDVQCAADPRRGLLAGDLALLHLAFRDVGAQVAHAP
jgi:hypothetical protein